MKTNRNRILTKSISSLLAVSALGTAPALRAATITWDGGGVGGTDIGVAVNWSTDTLPSVVTPDTALFDGTVAGALALLYNDASFSGAAGNTGINIQLAGTQTSSVNIDSGANTSSLRMNNLTIDAGAGAFSLGNGANVFNITLGGVAGQTHTWTNNSSNTATIASDVVFGLGGAGAHTLALAGSGNWTLGNVISDGGGTLSLSKNGTGTLTLTGVNTYTGGLTLNAGTLNINSAAAVSGSTGALTINGGTIDNTSGAAITTTAAKPQNWNGDFTFTGTNNLNFNGGVVTLGGFGANRTVTVNGGTLTEGSMTGFGYGLIKAGAGTLTLGTALSRITGNVSITGGKLQIGINDFVDGGTLSGSGTLENGSATGRWFFVNGGNQSSTFSGTIQNGGTAVLGLHKDGAGTLTLTGPTSYTDRTTIGGGTIEYGSTSFTGITRTVSTGGTAPGLNFDKADGAVKSSSDGTGTATLTFGLAPARTAGATGNFIVSGGTNGTTNSIKLTQAIGFINQGYFFNGDNYAWMNAANTYVRGIAYGSDTGAVTSGTATTLASATHQEFTGNINGQNTATFTTLKDNGNNAFTLASGQTVTVNGILKTGNVAGGATISGGTGIQAASGAELVVRTDKVNDSLTISTPILANGASSLTKSGAGSLTLSAANTYTGTTAVAGGTLNVTGSIAAASTITVDGGVLNFSGASGAGTTQITVTGAANGILNVLPGAVISRNNLIVGQAHNGAAGMGAVYQSGGSLSLVQAGNVADFQLGNGTNGYGYYKMSGGTLTLNEMGIGGSTSAGTTGVMEVTNGGSVTNSGWVTMARGTGNTSGVLTVDGGSLSAARVELNWGTGQSVVNVKNGTISTTGSTTIGLNLASSSNIAGTLGVVNLLSGGTFTTGFVTASQANPTVLLNFNGGTLKAAATNAGATFMTSANIDAVTVQSGGGTVDNNATNVTISTPLQAPAGSGVSAISFSGGTGYIGAPMVLISGGGGTGATANATIDANGNLTGFVITNPGTGYTSTPNVALLFGGGGGATIGAVTLTANTGGAMTFSGTGTTTLAPTAANTYSGGTVVSSGTLFTTGTTSTIMSNVLGTGPVTVNSGATLRIGGTNSVTATIPGNFTVAGGSIKVDDAFQHLAGTFNVTAPSTLGSTYNAGNNSAIEQDKGLFLDGVVSGSANLTLQHTGLSTGNTYNASIVHFTNSANTYSGTVTVVPMSGNNGGSYLGLSAGNALQFATVNLAGNNTSAGQSFGTSPIVFKTGLGTANIGALSGGANVVLTGYDEINHVYMADAVTLSVGGINSSTSFSGDISGVGNLTKVGTGTLTLSGNGTFGGQTTVTNGTLAVSGAGVINGTGIVVNGSGAKFSYGSSTILPPTVTLTNGTVDGIGSMIGVNVANLATNVLRNGNGTPGAQLSIGSLTFAGAANVSLLLNGATPGITVGALTSGAGTVTIDASNPVWNTGTTYDLITYGGGSIGGSGFGSFSKGTIVGLGARQFATLGDSTTAITLSITGDLPVWTGPGNGKWTTVIQSPTKNWNLQTAATPTDFIPNDTVLFDDTATGTTTVNIADANVAPSSTTFNNSALNYTITGAFGIASGPLTKNGTGTVTIATANTYTGATALNSGTTVITGSLGNTAVTVDASAALSLQAANAISQNTVTVNGTFSQTVDNALSGTATLVLNNGGTFTNANSHNGGTTLNPGSFLINQGAGVGTGLLTIGSPITIDNTSGASVTLTNNNPQAWANNLALTFTGTNALNFGTGAITFGPNASSANFTIQNNSALAGTSLTIGGAITPGVGGTPGIKNLTINGSDTALTGSITTGSATQFVINDNLAGTLTLSGAASNITTLYINSGGTVEVGAGNLGVANGGISIVQAVNGGTINGTGGGSIVLNSPNGDFGTAGGTTLTVNAKLAGTNQVDFWNAIGGTGFGTIILAGANTSTGGFNVQNTKVVIPATGAINALNTANSGQINVASVGGFAAELDVNGGTINATKTAAPGFTVGIASGAVGTLNMDSGLINVTSEMWLSNGAGGQAAFTMSGGQINVGSWFVVGRSFGTATLNLSGGTISKAAANYIIIGSLAGNGTLTQTGGALNAAGGGVRIGENNGTTPALGALWDMSGGSSSISGEINVAWRSSQARWNVSGPTTTVTSTGRLIVGAEVNNTGANSGAVVNGNPVGTVSISGGSVTFSGADNRIGGDIITTTTGASGTVNVSGGTLNFGGNVQIGAYGLGTMTVTGTGAVNSTAGFPSVGRFAGGRGVLTINGGTFSQTNGASFLIVGEDGTGTLNLLSGAANSVALRVGHTATGVGIVNIDGGTLTTGTVSRATGSGILNFGGGTLKASSANATFMTGLTGSYVYAGGAVIDSNSFDIGIAQPLLAPTGLGVTGITIAGGTGYAGTPLVVITGDGVGATAVANIDGSGNLTGITVTNPGTGYTTASATLNGGGGSGAVVSSVDLAPNSSGGLTKNGNGLLTLSGANTYGGNTTVNGGSIAAGNNSAFSTGTVTITSTGTRLVVNDGITIASAIILNGTSPGVGIGEIQGSGTGTSSLTGPITINASTTSGGHFAGGGGTLVVNGPITSSVPVQVRAGNTVFSGGGSYTAITLSGAPRIGANNGLSTTAVADIAINENSTFDLNGFNQEIAGLTHVSANTASVTNSSATASTLNVNVPGANSYSYSGTVNGNLTLTKSGSGTESLSGTNTHTGGTNVTGGVLNVNADAALGASAGAVSISNGATLQASGAVTTTARTVTLGTGGGTIDTTTGNTVNLDAGSTVTGSTLTKAGNGTLILGGTQTYSTLTTSAGTTNVNSALGTGSSTLNANATTNIGASQTLSALNIGAGAVVTFGDGPFAFGFGDAPEPAFAGGSTALTSAAVVPEPGSMALLLTSALGLLCRRRRCS
jgi:autotransporter-associated beta strand protein